MRDKIKELTLMLLYLTSWNERGLTEQCPRSWKGYDFDILNELSDSDWITGSHKSKSVYLTEDGVAEAKNCWSVMGSQRKRRKENEYLLHQKATG